MRRRSQREEVEHESLAVAGPAAFQKAPLGLPSVGEKQAAVQRPREVAAAVERIGRLANGALLPFLAVEVGRRDERAGQQVRGVDRGKLAVPRAPPRAHVEEVVEEAAVTRGVSPLAFLGVPEEPKRRERAGRGFVAVHEPPRDADRIGGQGEADGGDRGGGAVVRAVPDEAAPRVRLVEEIGERVPLEEIELGFGEDAGLALRLHASVPTALCRASERVGWIWIASRRTFTDTSAFINAT